MIADKLILMVFPTGDMCYPKIKHIIPYYDLESPGFDMAFLLEELLKRNGMSLDAYYYLYEYNKTTGEYECMVEDDAAQKFADEYLNRKPLAK